MPSRGQKRQIKIQSLCSGKDFGGAAKRLHPRPCLAIPARDTLYPEAAQDGRAENSIVSFVAQGNREILGNDLRKQCLPDFFTKPRLGVVR